MRELWTIHLGNNFEHRFNVSGPVLKPKVLGLCLWFSQELAGALRASLFPAADWDDVSPYQTADHGIGGRKFCALNRKDSTHAEIGGGTSWGSGFRSCGCQVGAHIFQPVLLQPLRWKRDVFERAVESQLQALAGRPRTETQSYPTKNPLVRYSLCFKLWFKQWLKKMVSCSHEVKEQTYRKVRKSSTKTHRFRRFFWNPIHWNPSLVGSIPCISRIWSSRNQHFCCFPMIWSQITVTMSTHLAKYADSIKFRQVGKLWKRGGMLWDVGV